MARAGCDGHRLLHHRPGRRARPGPGRAPVASWAWLPGALRHRRRGGLRDAGRAGRSERRTDAARRCTFPTCAFPCIRRSCPSPPPACCPAEVRPALLWTIDLDEAGDPTKIDVRRARVRSRDQFDYASVQKMIDSGTDDDRLLLLRDVGLLRIERERERGGVDLPMAEQEVEAADDGYTIRFRAQLPVERWNAQISLLTGMSAAELMLYGGHRHPADVADTRAVGVRAVAPGGAGTWRALGRLGVMAGRRPSAGSRGPAWRRPGHGVDPTAAWCRLYHIRRWDRRSRPSMRGWPRSTPMSRRRCGGSSTGTRSRCASLVARRSTPGMGTACDAALACRDGFLVASGQRRGARRPRPGGGDVARHPGRSAIRRVSSSTSTRTATAASCRWPRQSRCGRGSMVTGCRWGSGSSWCLSNPTRRAGSSVSRSLRRRLARTADEPAGRPRAGKPVRGKSGLHRARWWATPTRGDPRDSATENRPPARFAAPVRVKRWCKRPPALEVTRAAR